MKASTKQIAINPTYSELVHPLTEYEYQDLKKSIAESGQFMPIIVNTEGIILDGHHRWRICRELSIKPEITMKDFESSLFEKLFVIDCNLKRRHLNSYQKGVLTLKKKPIYEEISRMNMSLGGKGGKNLTPLNRVNGKLGKEVGVSHETIRKIEIIQKKASEEDKQKLVSGQKTISKIYRKIQKEDKRRELMMMKPVMSLPKKIKLFLGDFREKAKEIRPDSIDLIFCDPPYDADGIALYGELAKLAERILKDGGSMVVYVGQYHFPQVMDSIQSHSHKLRYWWMLCSQLNHYHGLVHRRHIYSSWKPLLFYVKGDRLKQSVDSMSDFMQSTEPEKALYRYEQSVEEAEYIIKHLTVENQIVFDPMMGSGTSGIAALANKRKFIGCEKDRPVFELAKRRISHSMASIQKLLLPPK